MNLSKIIGFDDIFAFSCQEPKKMSHKIAGSLVHEIITDCFSEGNDMR